MNYFETTCKHKRKIVDFQVQKSNMKPKCFKTNMVTKYHILFTSFTNI